MTVRELIDLLKDHDPDAEVTVSVWDGDYSLENKIDNLIDWGDPTAFVSIQHSQS